MKAKLDEIERYRRRNPWVAEWYARNGTIRQMWFRTLKEAQIEAEKHRDAEVFKEQQPVTQRCGHSDHC